MPSMLAPHKHHTCRQVAVREGANLTYLYQDHLGSAAVAVDASTNRAQYLPYGSRRDSADLGTSYTYTGQQALDGLDVLNYGARWYDPITGRFLQADTIVPEPGNPQSLNRYAYCLNNPLKYTDPTGHAHDAGGANGWYGWFGSFDEGTLPSFEAFLTLYAEQGPSATCIVMEKTRTLTAEELTDELNNAQGVDCTTFNSFAEMVIYYIWVMQWNLPLEDMPPFVFMDMLRQSGGDSDGKPHYDPINNVIHLAPIDGKITDLLGFVEAIGHETRHALQDYVTDGHMEGICSTLQTERLGWAASMAENVHAAEDAELYRDQAHEDDASAYQAELRIDFARDWLKPGGK